MDEKFPPELMPYLLAGKPVLERSSEQMEFLERAKKLTEDIIPEIAWKYICEITSRFYIDFDIPQCTFIRAMFGFSSHGFKYGFLGFEISPYPKTRSSQCSRWADKSGHDIIRCQNFNEAIAIANKFYTG